MKFGIAIISILFIVSCASYPPEIPSTVHLNPDSIEPEGNQITPQHEVYIDPPASMIENNKRYKDLPL